MKVDVGASYDTRVAQALGDENLRTALDRATGRLVERRAAAIAAVDNTRFRNEAQAVRQYTIQHLPELLEELERNLTANGCHVHWAQDAEEASRIVVEIARQHEVRHVVKSKSMVTEEIGLNKALEQSGVSVVETDLGEYIVQLADEPPSHILAPVIHKRAEDISELFQQKLGMSPSNDPAHMCSVARRELRHEFLRAEMGVSGCNFAIAETGTICVITNEGNGRMVTSMPPVHVVVAGIERIVPRIEDAVLTWQAASRNATGQDVSVYFSLSSGPRRPGHADGPDEMHVVLVDNGRSRVLERGYGDALLCIRCSACINECPVYREIGGHAYGQTVYSGPIGAVITPLLADDPLSACELPYASTLCGACRDVCPVKIDLPRLLLDLRGEMTRLGGAPKAERMAMRIFAAAARRPWRFRWAVSIARMVTSLFSRRSQDTIDALPPPLGAWTKTRAFPRLAPKSFRKLWGERNG